MEERENRETKKQNTEIELRSPAVQEILGRPPKWIIRWGITVVLGVIGIIFIGSFFFKYPNVVPTQIEVTTENLPAQLVAKATGKLDTFFVVNNEIVEPGTYLAVIENTACFNDILTLTKQLKDFYPFFSNHQENVHFKIYSNLKLGDLQNSYYQFIKAWEDYEYFIKTDYHNQKINALRKQIAIQQKLAQRTSKQSTITKEQLLTQERLFAIDSNLYAKKTITLIEYENAKNTYLQTQQAYENALSSVDNMQMTIAQYEQNVFDLQQQANDKKKELIISFSGAYENLQTQINQWEMQYVFKSPIAGKVSLAKQWQKNQHINTGEVFLNIVPNETTHIKGKIMLPAQGAGKVKTGQSVNVKFDGYPYMEFGIVKGIVKSISLVPIATPQGKFTMVEVDFPHNLATNYRKQLEFSQEMSGTAEIITEDLRLIERFFNPIKSLIKR